MVYKSKIGWGLVAVLAVLFIGCAIPMLLDDSWPGIVVLLPAFAFAFHTLATTYYVVEDDVLKVKSGLFYNRAFQIKAFRKIIKTNSAITAPAASNDRLELFFNGYDSVVISPKDKESFIAHLQSINPHIIYEDNFLRKRSI